MQAREKYSTGVSPKGRPGRMRVNVAIGIIRSGNRVLIGRRPARRHLGGLWEFPGGKAAPGEPPRATLHRELWEELAVRVRVVAPWPPIRQVYADRVVTLYPFVCRLVRGRPRPAAVTALRWVATDRLGRYRFPSANRRLIRRLAAGGRKLANIERV